MLALPLDPEDGESSGVFGHTGINIIGSYIIICQGTGENEVHSWVYENSLPLGQCI